MPSHCETGEGCMKKTLLSTLILSASLAQGQESGGLTSAYSFGGACASQGVWTQSALSATQSLRRITLQLKDDPNCQALGKSTMSALAELEAQVRDVSDSPRRSTRLSQIPAEIEALRTFATSSPELKSDVMRLMMNRSIEGATLSAQVGAESASTAVANNMSTRMEDFGERIQRSTKAGVGILSKVVDSLPQLDQCLMGDGQQALGNFMASTIRIATAFAGSGQDSTGSQMAQLVSKLTGVTRERKFTKVLRKLNQQEFLSSMSCLLEVTSESYCQARDAMGLFTDGMNNIEWRQTKGKSAQAANPFMGYYVLNTHVPNITKWMQKIQIGVDPKLPTDADFQNKIQQEVVDFYKGFKTLLGTYNSTLLTIKQLPSDEAKRNAVVKLVIDISDSMMGNRHMNDKTNFFTMNKSPLKIPFFLIGMDDAPAQVAGKAAGMMPISAEAWLQANYSDLPQFKDPIALAETVGRNMQDLARDANISVISYFSNWYIVDKQALVNEALTDVNYTVKDSLVVIYDYLEIVKNRVENTGDSSIVSTIMDTQNRIRLIMQSFEEVERMGKKFASIKSAKNLTEEDIKSASMAAEKLINTVFDQFMVMQARSGFLANRMVNFVYQDYIQLLKSENNFSDKQKEIFIQAGMAALDRMLQMYSGNPALIKSDLNMALKINKGNLEALEDLLKDSVIANIASLKMNSEGRKSDNWGTMKDTILRVMKDAIVEQKVLPITSMPVAFYKQYFKYQERYPLTGNGTSSPQSEFDESTYLHAQLCVQALAFNDQEAIQSLCNEAVLKSPFKGVQGYDISYRTRLLSHRDDKNVNDSMKQSLNHSDRICAFRDFNRKNMVLFMSMNKK